MELKRKVLDLVENEIDRKGQDKLVSYLKKSDYFIAPASVKYHLNYEGGLIEHCDNVFEIYKRLRKDYNLEDKIPMESVIIESYFHDLCKVNKYKKVMKNSWTDGTKKYLLSLMENNPVKVVDNNINLPVDNDGNIKDITQEYASELINYFKYDKNEVPEKENFEKDWGWNYKDNEFPCGHGEKSVIIIQHYMKMYKREMLAIRWHMSAFEDGVYGGYKNRDFNRSKELYPDIQLLQLADYEASFKENL